MRPNLLGDPRAEADDVMLERAFQVTPDYRTLIETSDRVVVVGRRGTGKSALVRALNKYWSGARVPVVKLIPEESQVIGVRPLAALFGEKFTRIRAGMRLIWRYALMLEISIAIERRSKAPELDFVKTKLPNWITRGVTIPDRVKSLMKEVVSAESAFEARIGDLPGLLEISKTEQCLASAFSDLDSSVVLLVDTLDEGYEPDNVGVGLVDGLVQAAIDLKTAVTP